MANTLCWARLIAMANTGASTGYAAEGTFLLQVSVLLVAFLVVMIFAAGAGAVAIPGREVLSIVWSHLGFAHAPADWPASDELILLHIRFPRVLGAALV